MSCRYWKHLYFPLHTFVLSSAIVLIFYLLPTKEYDNLKLPIPSTIHDTKWWHFFACQLLHIDNYHLWNNVLILLTLGSIFEAIHGPITSIVVFWSAGAVGIMTESGWWALSPTYLVGSSAGAYALIGGYVSHLLMNWTETPFRKLWVLLFTLCVTITIVFYIVDFENNRFIAHIAHGVGFIQGVLTANATVKNIRIIRIENLIIIVSFLIASSNILSVWYRLTIMNN